MSHIELATRDGRRVRDAKTRDLVLLTDARALFGRSNAACLRVADASVDVFSDLSVRYTGSNDEDAARFRCRPSNRLLEIGGSLEFKRYQHFGPVRQVIPNYWRRTSNLQLLYRQGPVGIGRSDPAESLDVDGWVRSTGSLLLSSDLAELDARRLVLKNSNQSVYLAGRGGALGCDAATATLNGRLSFGHPSVDIRIGSNSIGVASNALRIGADGSFPRVRVGALYATAPSVSLAVQGSIMATGNVTSLSDARAKADVLPIERALERVSALSGYTFEMAGQRRTGLLSQEMQAVIPELFVDSSMSIAYENAVALAIEALREIAAKLISLRERLRSLQNLSMN